MGSKEKAINGKRKNWAQEETLVVSATMGTHVEKQPSSPAPKLQTQSDGKILRKGELSEAVVCLERDPEDRAKTTISGKCTEPIM